MAYQLRIDGRPEGTWDTLEEARARASALLREHPDCEPEILDAATGAPAAPGASRDERDDYATKVGF